MSESDQTAPHETIEQARRQAAADVDLEPLGDDDEFDDPWEGYAGDQRAGRLIAPDEVVREDIDPEAVAHSAGGDEDEVVTDDAALQEGDEED